MNRQNFFVWSGLSMLAIAFRLITFFPLTIDMDESTYLVMADHLFNGGTLYKDVIDIKPPGVFIIFLGIQFLFGKSVFIVRLVAALFVSTGGYLIYRANRNLGSGFWPSVFSGAVFIFMFNFYFGFSANTEIFFVFFTTLAIWSYSKVKDGIYFYLISGLFLGLGFLIKLHVAFDALALGLFIVIVGFLAKSYQETFLRASLLTIGFLVPFATTHLIFLASGNYEYYHFITYEAPFNYSAERDAGILIKYFKDGIVTYLPFIILAVVGFLNLKSRLGKIRWLFVLMFCLEWLAILATGKPHPHYWLQISLPVALLSVGFFENQKTLAFFNKKVVRISSFVLVLGYLTFLFNYYNNRYLKRNSHSVNIYEFLKPKVKESDKIYTGDGPQILYWLFDKKSPTPHIHQNHLTYPEKIATYKVDVEKEMKKIFSSSPRFVILSENYPHLFVKEMMEMNYLLIHQTDGFNIYEIKKP